MAFLRIWPGRNFALYASIIIVVAAQSTTASAEHRTTFFGDRPLGAIAWISSATSGAQARRATNYLALEGETCFELPRRTRYYFAVNHYAIGQPSRRAFASIRIIAEDPGFPNGHVSLYRNRSTWAPIEGPPRSDTGTRVVPAIAIRTGERNMDNMTPGEFASLHSTSGMNSEQRRARRIQIQERTSNFHGALNSNTSSWDHRHLFSLDRLGVSASNLSRLNVYNLAFHSNTGWGRINPVTLFYERGRAKSIRIIVDIVGFAETTTIKRELRIAPMRC